MFRVRVLRWNVVYIESYPLRCAEHVEIGPETLGSSDSHNCTRFTHTHARCATQNALRALNVRVYATVSIKNKNGIRVISLIYPSYDPSPGSHVSICGCLRPVSASAMWGGGWVGGACHELVAVGGRVRVSQQGTDSTLCRAIRKGRKEHCEGSYACVSSDPQGTQRAL